jgi:hypothetical protein
MKKPVVLTSLDNAKIICKLFDTPFMVICTTWLPVAECLLAVIHTWVTGLKHPDRSLRKRTITGSFSMVAVLSLEWCYNLTHAAAAWLIQKPMVFGNNEYSAHRHFPGDRLWFSQGRMS